MAHEALQNELDKLSEEVLKMGRLLEEQIYNAVKALIDKDVNLAEQVIANDEIIDQMENDIERKSLSLIALKQPMAGDLRLTGSFLRLIIDIERMADHAEDIARIALDLHEQTYIKPLIDIPRMAKLGQDMVDVAMKAFIERDVDLAMSIVPMEIEMDGLYDQVFRELLLYMMQDHRNIAQATSLLLVAGHLERIADHATNLAEIVVFVVEGRRIDINARARRREKQGDA
jgi:phosphate transport system protein